MSDLLFLCHRIPYPPDKGDKIRAFQLIRRLSRSFRIHLGCLADDPDDLKHAEALKAWVARCACFPLDRRVARWRALKVLGRSQPLSFGYFQDARLRAWVAETLASQRIAKIFVFSSAMAPYVMGVPNVPRILDMVDVDSEKFAAYAQQGGFPMRPVWAREARTLLAFERRAVGHFDRTLFVSAAEEARFLALAPECAGRTTWVENGVDLEHFSPRYSSASPIPADETAVVFTGTMDYKPNVDAVSWFAHSVLPLLAARRRPPVFYIVGSNPTRSVRELERILGVRVTGRVGDTRPFLAHAAAVVAPLRIGRGVQNKVLEGMAMGRPVVASPAAVEGIRAEVGRDVLVAADARETARVIGEVLDGEHAHVGTAARQAVEHFHNWDRTLARLDVIMDGSATALTEETRVYA